jgi:hypothetical protein
VDRCLAGAEPAPPAAASRDVRVFGLDMPACVSAWHSIRMMDSRKTVRVKYAIKQGIVSI